MKKRFLALFLGILAIAILISGCGNKVESKSELEDIFKKLDAKDYEVQNLVEDKAKANKTLKEIYMEPQLSKAIKYVDDMRANRVRLELYEVTYEKIEVLEQTEDTAKLSVVSHPRGSYFTIKYPPSKLGPLEEDLKFTAILKKKNDKWFISEIQPAPEEQEAEGAQEEKQEEKK